MKTIDLILSFTLTATPIGAQAAGLSLEEKKEAITIAVEGLADLKPGPRPVREVPTVAPVAQEVTAATIKKGLASFPGSFTFKSRGDTDIVVDSKPAWVEGRSFVTADLRWSNAYEGQRAVPIAPIAPSRMVPLSFLDATISSVCCMF
jgi:hypothetical protein